MGRLMSGRCALLRLIEDEAAPIGMRFRALQEVEHPPLKLLQRLLVEKETPRSKPVPAKLKALAALKHAREMELRKIRKLQKGLPSKQANALGI
jgi:hypothetical protein